MWPFCELVSCWAFCVRPCWRVACPSLIGLSVRPCWRVLNFSAEGCPGRCRKKQWALCEAVLAGIVKKQAALNKQHCMCAFRESVPCLDWAFCDAALAGSFCKAVLAGAGRSNGLSEAVLAGSHVGFL